MVSLEIGTGTVITGAFSSINWSNGPYFIKTETDPTGGTSYSITGTSQLLSVPYALYAANSGSSTPGPQGATGPQGPQGATGPQGPAGLGGFTHYIGEEFGGGVVFHLWKDASGVEHGLIIDKIDLSSAHVWSNIDLNVIGPSAQSSWDGLSNSNAIVGQAGHTSSASALCLNSTNGAQSDWYLPSIDELSLLWHSRFNVNKSLSAIGGAIVLPNSGYYWSSTELGFSGTAYYFYFDSGYAYVNYKYYTQYVRAIRAF